MLEEGGGTVVQDKGVRGKFSTRHGRERCDGIIGIEEHSGPHNGGPKRDMMIGWPHSMLFFYLLLDFAHMIAHQAKG